MYFKIKLLNGFTYKLLIYWFGFPVVRDTFINSTTSDLDWMAQILSLKIRFRNNWNTQSKFEPINLNQTVACWLCELTAGGLWVAKDIICHYMFNVCNFECNLKNPKLIRYTSTVFSIYCQIESANLNQVFFLNKNLNFVLFVFFSLLRLFCHSWKEDMEELMCSQWQHLLITRRMSRTWYSVSPQMPTGYTVSPAPRSLSCQKRKLK